MSKENILPTLEQFEKNAYLRQFLSPNFSSEDFLRENLKRYSQTNYFSPLDEIKKGLKILDDNVKVEIKRHHEPMIQNMLHTLELSKEVNNISAEVTRLCRSSDKVRKSFKDKFDIMNQRCQQFRNICSTSEKLRILDRYLRLYRNVHAQSHLDLPVVARNLLELEKLVVEQISSEDQSKIRIYRTTIPNISKIKKNMINEADRLFKQSLKDYPRNLLEFELAFEVFFVFGILERRIRDFVNSKRNEVIKEMKSIEKKKYTTLQDLFGGLGYLFDQILLGLSEVCCAFQVTEKKTDSLSMEVGKSYFTILVGKDPKLCPEYYFRRIFLPMKSSTASIGKNGLLLRYLRVHCEHNHGFYVKYYPQIHEFMCEKLLFPLYQTASSSTSDSASSSLYFTGKSQKSISSSSGNFNQLLVKWVPRETRLKFRKLFEQILFAPFHEVFIQKMIYQRFRMELEQALFSPSGVSGSSLVPKTPESYDVISRFPSEKRLRKFLRNLLKELKKYQVQVGSKVSVEFQHHHHHPSSSNLEEEEEDEEDEGEEDENGGKTPLLFEPMSGTVIYVEILEKIQIILTSLVDTYKGFIIDKPNYVYFMKREEEELYTKSIMKKTQEPQQEQQTQPQRASTPSMIKKRNLLLHKPNAYVTFHSRLFQHLEVLFVYLDDYLDLLVNPSTSVKGAFSSRIAERYRSLFDDFDGKMDEVRKLMNSLIQPLFDVFGTQISKILFMIQWEKYDEVAGGSDPQSSSLATPQQQQQQSSGMVNVSSKNTTSTTTTTTKVHWYVLELEKNLLSFNRNYLQLFGSGKYLRKMLKRKSESIVEEYCSAISLIAHPITKKGQMILLRELTQVDLSLCNSFYYVKNLAIYRDLSEFKGLLFLFEDAETCWDRIRKIVKVFVKKLVLLQYLLSHFVYVLRMDEDGSMALKSETFPKILLNFKSLKEYYAYLEVNKHDLAQVVDFLREKLDDYIKIAKMMSQSSNLGKNDENSEQQQQQQQQQQQKEEEEVEVEVENSDNNEILGFLNGPEIEEYKVILEIMEIIRNESSN